MTVEICVGSSCHLKGSPEIVELFQKKIAANSLDTKLELVGCFCTGKCNREGVTIVVDGNVHTGVTVDKFDEFFEENILKKL